MRDKRMIKAYIIGFTVIFLMVFIGIMMFGDTDVLKALKVSSICGGIVVLVGIINPDGHDNTGLSQKIFYNTDEGTGKVIAELERLNKNLEDKNK